MNTAGKDLRAPLKDARGLGSAKSGAHRWWLERVTSAALVPLTLYFIWLLMSLAHADYAAVLATIAQPWHALLLIVLAICTFWHGALGLQVIIEDYVHTRWLEITLRIAVSFGASLGALACVMAVLAIWLGRTPNF
ncbi:MAG TPA: succinate dehydrogenase, hydrophobic membrane anchor protein [Rhodanobacteraceae bacterium]|nr:succinate dehydrogenase, hydrophobic membrane anchor protein [Rhodanobacteraceae bacterium]